MSELPAKAPTPNVETQRFWDATAEGRIELPRCDGCRLVIWYPRGVCPDCQSTALTWEVMAGTGTIYSYTVARSGVGRRWKEHLPFVVAYVRLDEGPTMLTNIVDCDPETVAIGQAVTAVFDDTGEGSALVRFRPA
jgi:uncharacterized OB-fold protein